MRTATIFGLKSCDTCRKALKEMNSAGWGASLVDVREVPMKQADLAAWHDQFGPDLVNRRSTTWRGLDDAARMLPVVALLLAHPPVMKRPVVDAEGTLYLGWSANVRKTLLG